MIRYQTGMAEYIGKTFEKLLNQVQAVTLSETITRNLMQDPSRATVERRYGKERGGEGSTGSGNMAALIPSGSIAELENQIAEVRKNFLNATTDEARRSADELIKVLEGRKAYLEIAFKYPAGMGNIAPVDKFADVSGKIDVPHVDMSGVFQVPEVKTYSDHMAEAARKNEALRASIYGVGDAMQGLSNLLGESGGFVDAMGRKRGLHGWSIHSGSQTAVQCKRLRGGIRGSGSGGRHPHRRPGSRGRCRPVDHGGADEHSEVRVWRNRPG